MKCFLSEISSQIGEPNFTLGPIYKIKLFLLLYRHNLAHNLLGDGGDLHGDGGDLLGDANLNGASLSQSMRWF